MNDPRKYNVCVRFTEGDGFCATVKELPDVAVYEETSDEAYQAALAVIGDLQDIFAEKGKSFPAPWDAPVEASGRITLRMGKSLHQRCITAAEDDNISLNSWLVEAAALRLDGHRVAVIHAPSAISINYSAGTNNSLSLTDASGQSSKVPLDTASRVSIRHKNPLLTSTN